MKLIQRKHNSTAVLSEGSVIRVLIIFALPLLGSSLIQQLYSSVDLAFVGNILGKEAAAAVGSGSLLIATVIDFFIGLGVGVNILCAHAFGAEDHDRLQRLIHTSIVLALTASILFTAAGWFFTPQILKWYGTPVDVVPSAVTYMRIYFLGLTAIITFNVSSGILRALGDSRTPMLCQLLGGAANIIGDFIFIYILRLGVAGAALATVLSQTAAMLLAVSTLRKLPEEFRLTLRRLRMDPRDLGRILMVGIPTAVQSMIITFSNLVMQMQINQLGVSSIAAFMAFYKVDALVYIPLQTIGQAMVTFTGQNLGAKKPERIRRGLFTSWCISLTIAIIFGGAISFLHYPFYRMFIADETVIAIGGAIGRSAFLYYILYSYCENLSSTLRGAGKTFGSMVLTLLSIVVLRFPIIFLLFGRFRSAGGLALIYPITWSFASIAFTIYYLHCRKDIFHS